MSCGRLGGAAGSSIQGNDRKPSDSCSAAATQDLRLIDAKSVSLERQLACIQREIRIRKQVYVTRVATRRMTARKAAAEIACMEAVAATLRDLLEEQRS
jgi:hypothetical protein